MMTEIEPTGAARETSGQLDGRYVYCVVPHLEQALGQLRGLGGAPVYELRYRDLGAIVHDCPAAPYQGEGEQVRTWLLSHHDVIEAVWAMAGTVLPMGFDVIVRGDDEATPETSVVAWLQANHAAFRERLASLAGKAEVSIKITWDRARAAVRIAAEDREVLALQAELEGKSKGLAFFHQQRIKRHIQTRLDAEADEIRQDCLVPLRALADELICNQPKHPDGREMLLNLSVLAEQRLIGEIGDLLGVLRDRRQVEVSFTGPWPPYSFTGVVATPERT